MGLGYVGLPLAVELAKAGFRVLGFDMQQNVVDGLNAGHSHIKDVTDAQLQAVVKAGRFSATTDMLRLAEPDAISICVPTPLSKFKDPGRQLHRGRHRGGQANAPPRAGDHPREHDLPRHDARDPAAGAREHRTHGGRGLLPGVQPRAGRPRQPDLRHPEHAQGRRRHHRRLHGAWPMALYQPAIDTLVPVSTTEAAELVKLLENTFRSVNIGLVNEMAIVCDKLGVDVWEVIEAAATKPFGFMKFTARARASAATASRSIRTISRGRCAGSTTRPGSSTWPSEINTEMPLFWVAEGRRGAERRGQGGARQPRCWCWASPTSATSTTSARARPSTSSGCSRSRAPRSPTHDPHVPVVRARTGTSFARCRSAPRRVAAADCVMIVTDHSSVDYRA